ncbi:hypothetical protein UFOVP121_82 [uncultured Caudovirales phage]|uniref:Uncharacterized protein n=1 Tax=uncultured Caudovirales phage TaxID=2100421 RepID=A0A6J5LKI4_9CAUD|nr:hypothetical protein UFOVP121_82 [uncultured Caudovirales phage]CAB4134705.1 hypothetical protein UFOVP277_1 [uncultured Caudovirales phage]
MICDQCETVAHCLKNGCVPKTTKKDEAMKLALEALNLSSVTVDSFGVQQKTNKAITALREALNASLAEPPAHQEPVAWMWVTGGKPHYVTFGGANSDTPKHWIVLPLYTSPPAQRTWVGLTDDERKEAFQSCEIKTPAEFLKAIEAKLKEKNNV